MLKCKVHIHSHLHVVFEDVGSSGHVHDVVDDELAESCEQISPFVESLDLVGFVLLVSLWGEKKRRKISTSASSLSHSYVIPKTIRTDPKTERPLTHALTLIVLVDEDVVQDEVEQLVLQRAVRVKDQRLQALPAARRQLVTEDHQQVAEKHERL